MGLLLIIALIVWGIVAAVRATPPRSGWMRVAGIVGGLMVVDSIAELSLAKHVSKRFARRAGEA